MPAGCSGLASSFPTCKFSERGFHHQILASVGGRHASAPPAPAGTSRADRGRDPGDSQHGSIPDFHAFGSTQARRAGAGSARREEHLLRPRPSRRSSGRGVEASARDRGGKRQGNCREPDGPHRFGPGVEEAGGQGARILQPPSRKVRPQLLPGAVLAEHSPHALRPVAAHGDRRPWRG